VHMAIPSYLTSLGVALPEKRRERKGLRALAPSPCSSALNDSCMDVANAEKKGEGEEIAADLFHSNSLYLCLPCEKRKGKRGTVEVSSR